MKISLLEPIGIPEEMVKELAAGFEQEGHSFAYYDTKTTDVEELKRRSAGQDIVMIANNDRGGFHRDRSRGPESMPRQRRDGV